MGGESDGARAYGLVGDSNQGFKGYKWSGEAVYVEHRCTEAEGAVRGGDEDIEMVPTNHGCWRYSDSELMVQDHFRRDQRNQRVACTWRAKCCCSCSHYERMGDRAADKGKIQGASGCSPGIRPGGDEGMGPGTGRVLKEGRPFLLGTQQDLVSPGGATFYSMPISEPQGRVTELSLGPDAD